MLISRAAPAAALLAAAAATSALAVPVDVCNPALPYTMPDHDQRRNPASGIVGLQNNGSQYCVPTCTMNILTYLGNHGYPNLSAGPGPGPWLGSTPIYNNFGTDIEALASLMNTDPMGGTGGNNALAGVNQWIASSGYTGDIIVSMFGVTANSAPELADVAFCLIARCPVSLSLGWSANAPPTGIVRTGGTCVSAVRLPDFCSPFPKLSIRDPGNSIGSDAFSQAAGTIETYNISTQVITRRDPTTNAVIYTGPYERTVGFGTMGFIDGYRAFFPAFGLSACNNPVNGSCVQQYTPNPSFTTVPQPVPFSLPATETVLDLDIAANNLGGWVLACDAIDYAVWRTHFGSPTPVEQSFPALTAFLPKRLCTALDPNILFAVNTPSNVIVKFNTKTGVATPLSSADPITAICFDHKRNELVAFSSSARRVTRINPDTGAPVSQRSLPTAVALGAEPRISICPKGSYLWLTSGLPTGHGLINDPANGTLLSVAATISSAFPLRGIDSDDRGHVYTTASGQILEFAEPVPPVPGGPWARVPSSTFAALADGPIFRIARTRTNYDRLIHDTPSESLNIFPSQFGVSVVDCPADYNANGALEVQDIFDYLNAWFAGEGDTDFDGLNGLEVADIFAFLNAWFAGCP